MSSIPPTSPERTMAMYTVGKTFGCLETACENDKPRSMSPRIDVITAAPVAINGRIAKPGERDRYRLAVTPGTTGVWARKVRIRSKI